MTISNKTFTNGTEVDLTNGEHTFPNLTLRKWNGDNHAYVIENYITRKVFATFNSLRDAVQFCNLEYNCEFTLEDGSKPGHSLLGKWHIATNK